MKQEKRILKRIKAELIERHEDPIVVADEFKVYLEMWRAGIPLKYWEHEPEDISDVKIQAAIQKYVSKMDQCIDRGIGLYFYGKQGVGKTLAACLILKEAIKKGYEVQFTMLTEILEKYCDAMYDEGKKAEFRRKILEADILVIDDIDKIHISQKSNFADATYDYLFRTRANSRLPFIVTSNMKPAEFINQEGMAFGNSLGSLFTEHLYEVEVVSRKDRRKDIQKKLEEFLNE